MRNLRVLRPVRKLFDQDSSHKLNNELWTIYDSQMIDMISNPEGRQLFYLNNRDIEFISHNIDMVLIC